jgi:phage anti-repressor protein
MGFFIYLILLDMTTRKNQRPAPSKNEQNYFSPKLAKYQSTSVTAEFDPEIIPIEPGELGLQVDSRLLYEKLESRRRYADWITERIREYGFIEGVDFFTNLRKSTGGRRATDYTVTLDVAKELAMVERNEIGRTIRRYFIAVEKQYRDWIGFNLPRLEKNFDLFGERLGYNYMQLLKSVELSTQSGAVNARKNRNPQEFWKNQSNVTFVSEAYSRNIIAFAAARKLSQETKLRRISFESQLALKGGL